MRYHRLRLLSSRLFARGALVACLAVAGLIAVLLAWKASAEGARHLETAHLAVLPQALALAQLRHDLSDPIAAIDAFAAQAMVARLQAGRDGLADERRRMGEAWPHGSTSRCHRRA